jgi:hypothetical protein
MARLPTSGSTVASPLRNEAEFKRVLSNLGVNGVNDETVVQELYLRLGAIIGRWLSELGRLNVSPVAKALLSMGKNLDEIAKILSGHETGMHSSFDIEIVSQLTKYLALDPTIGSRERAQEAISSFHREARRFAHTCQVASVDLATQTGQPGRPPLDWYDDFTVLLLEIADIGGVKPSLRKDRIRRTRSGWLFDAAQALETFLWPQMRSQNPEACGKRLERSSRRLKQGSGQKRSAR